MSTIIDFWTWISAQEGDMHPSLWDSFRFHMRLREIWASLACSPKENTMLNHAEIRVQGVSHDKLICNTYNIFYLVVQMSNYPNLEAAGSISDFLLVFLPLVWLWTLRNVVLLLTKTKTPLQAFHASLQR